MDQSKKISVKTVDPLIFLYFFIEKVLTIIHKSNIVGINYYFYLIHFTWGTLQLTILKITSL